MGGWRIGTTIDGAQAEFLLDQKTIDTDYLTLAFFCTTFSAFRSAANNRPR
jgi:hypothetical protein